MAKTKPERYCELADGTILDAEAGRSGDDLWIMYNDDTNFGQAWRALGNPEKARVIKFCYPGEEQTFEGFTEVITMRIDGRGKLAVRLHPGSAE